MSQLDDLIDQTIALLKAWDELAIASPDARLAHARPALALDALLRIRATPPRRPPAAVRHDQHTLDMADKLGITPDEFLAMQERKRNEMRGEA